MKNKFWNWPANHSIPFPRPECSIFLPSVTGQSVHATQQCLHLPLPLKFIISSPTTSLKQSQFKFFWNLLATAAESLLPFSHFNFKNNEMPFFITFEPRFSCLIFKTWNNSIQYPMKPRWLSAVSCASRICRMLYAPYVCARLHDILLTGNFKE